MRATHQSVAKGSRRALRAAGGRHDIAQLFTYRPASPTNVAANYAVSNAVKTVAAKYNAENLIVKRNVVAKKIEARIIAALGQYNVRLQAVNVTDFQFSKTYTQAIEQKQIAQQRALQASYDLQRVQIQAEQEVAQAQKLLQ